MSSYAERIKQAIERSGKTQRQVANDIGITEVSMSRYITGKRIPKAQKLIDIAKACNVPEMWLLTGKESPTKHVEMIIDYVTDGEDFQYNDNHGVLIRCRDCIFNGGDKRRCTRENGIWDSIGELDYCSKAVKA